MVTHEMERVFVTRYQRCGRRYVFYGSILVLHLSFSLYGVCVYFGQGHEGLMF
jgi:hypothetical protein